LHPVAINRKSIKSNILSQLSRPTTKDSVLSILVNSLNHHSMKQKEEDKNTGIARKKEVDSNL
jgi:hypothetical protein